MEPRPSVTKSALGERANPRPQSTYQVDIYEEALTSENALQLFEPYDVIVDGTDNFPTRYLVNDACVISGKPNVYGSIFKFEGQCTVFNYEADQLPRPLPRTTTTRPGSILRGRRCTRNPPWSHRLLQATETIKVLLGIGETLSGRLLTYDAMNMKLKSSSFARTPTPNPSPSLSTTSSSVAFLQTTTRSRKSRAMALSKSRRLASKQAVAAQIQLLDVREPTNGRSATSKVPPSFPWVNSKTE